MPQKQNLFSILTGNVYTRIYKQRGSTYYTGQNSMAHHTGTSANDDDYATIGPLQQQVALRAAARLTTSLSLQ